MKKLVILLLSLLLVQGASALSSTLLESYEQRETIIGQLSQDIIDIEQGNANVLRDGHIDIGFNGGIKKLGGSFYVWLPAPQNPGSYTLVVEDVIANVGGFPDVVTFEHDFVVRDNLTDYSINPGLILSSDDFDVVAILYEDFSKTIEVSYPFSRTVAINPGNNMVGFEIGEFVGNQFMMINVGKYIVPAYLIGKDSVCGDGEIDGNEICDGLNLGGETCISQGFDSGNLRCKANCEGYIVGECVDKGLECDENNLNLCMDENNCTQTRGFWYEGQCNKFEEGAECDEDHLGLCGTEGKCIDSKGFWYGVQCNGKEEETCDFDNLELCDFPGKCIDAGGNWFGEKCNEEREEKIFVPRFTFTPRIIRSTVYVGDKPGSYPFRLDNLGGRIEDFIFEYDNRKFVIEPSNLSVIGENESVYFNLSLRDFSGEPIRGAAVAYAGDVTEYLLFDLKLTSNRKDVGTSFSRNASVQAGYYCSELGGEGCNDGETCIGELVSSLDKTYCCVGQCEEIKSVSRTWIGYLIAAIIILILLIIYVKYKKAGKTGNPTQRRFASAERNLP